ncbi:glycosyl transferase, partial [Salmonella enterica]|nr:glycosyl transferase [Salmonella enterica]EJX7945702.1 glycosyl transferase [Salmonella enterica]
MKITLNTDGFNEWGGGVDFIKYLLRTLEIEQDIFLDVLLPREDISSLLKRNIFPVKNMIKAILRGQTPRWKKLEGFNEQYYKHAFAEITEQSKLSFITGKSSAYFSHYIKSDYDIILPCMRTPAVNMKNRAWLGYIYDFQHCYYPSFFSEREIAKRNLFFKRMLDNANNVIVNSHAVISDAKKFVGDFSANLHALPFSPCPELNWLNDNSDLIDKYAIDKDYFIICNQFWKHKDHSTAF